MRADVAPLAGAWIEIPFATIVAPKLIFVAPLAGAWIEIFKSKAGDRMGSVAPLAGAWIEIRQIRSYPRPLSSRSPRGSVD